MKTLIILRGLPSSGKTSFAQLIEPRAICSADDYHYNNNIYNWKAENIKKSHSWAIRKCRRFMQIRCSKVVIANTNTTEKEMQPYEELAKEYDYRIYHIIVENRHQNKNSHEVPEETIEKMRTRFDIKL